MAAWLPGATLLAGAVQRAPGAVGWWGQTGGGGGGCRGGRGGGGHWGTASIGAGDACILWRYHLNACTVHVLVHVRVCTVLSSKYYCSVNYLYNKLNVKTTTAENWSWQVSAVSAEQLTRQIWIYRLGINSLHWRLQVGDAATEMPKPDPKNQFLAAAVVSGVATVSIGIYHR